MSWVSTTVGEFAPLLYGKGLPKKARRNGPVKVFGSNGPIGEHDTSLVDEPGVIIGRKGSVGEVHYAAEPFWPIDTTYYVVADDGRDIRFTYYLLKHLGLQRLSGDSAVPGLNRNTAHSTTLRVPELRSQRQIAAVLGSIDDLIENNRRRIEVLEEMAQAIYREWFVHFRFPGHGGGEEEVVEMVDSKLGPIPKGWDVCSFTKLADFINGFAFKSSEHWLDDGLPIVKIKELKNGVTSGTPRYHGNGIAEKYFVDDGAVLFSWSADLDAYLWSEGLALLNQHLFVVRPYEVSELFLFHSLRGQMHEFRARAQGTTMKHIKRSALDEVHMALPDAAVRSKFEKVVRPMVDLEINLRQLIRSLGAMRNLLLPGLVSGEIDVSELDLDALVETSS